VKVPVAFLHEDTCPGLKAGGVLNVVRREIEVLADPDAVPEKFELDLAEAQIGAGLRWSDVKDQFGTKSVIAGRDFMVASIAAPTVVDDAAPAAAAGPVEATKQKAPAAGAAASTKGPAKKK
jgi:large subunit ribosomal protein L25